MLDKLKEFEERYAALNEELADPAVARNPAQYQKLAKEVGADVIVIATHGRGALKRAMFGSVAEKVVRVGLTETGRRGNSCRRRGGST